MDLLYFFCLVLVMSLCASVYLCLVVTCWERAYFFCFDNMSMCVTLLIILCNYCNIDLHHQNADKSVLRIMYRCSTILANEP